MGLKPDLKCLIPNLDYICMNTIRSTGEQLIKCNPGDLGIVKKCLKAYGFNKSYLRKFEKRISTVFFLGGGASFIGCEVKM